MKGTKRSIDSNVLGRRAHIDFFELAEPATYLFVLFGGSGVDEDEYNRRNESVIPIFDSVLSALANDKMTFVYITAPYDVPLCRFATEPASAVMWNTHILTEVLQPWERLPFFVCGFSGGAALAFNGVHMDQRCFGGAALGFDGLTADFEHPTHWREKLRLYCAPDDMVCNHPTNRAIINKLENRDQAEEIYLRTGRHQLADYATMECLGQLIKFACQLTSN